MIIERASARYSPRPHFNSMYIWILNLYDIASIEKSKCQMFERVCYFWLRAAKNVSDLTTVLFYGIRCPFKCRPVPFATNYLKTWRSLEITFHVNRIRKDISIRGFFLFLKQIVCVSRTHCAVKLDPHVPSVIRIRWDFKSAKYLALLENGRQSLPYWS